MALSYTIIQIKVVDKVTGLIGCNNVSHDVRLVTFLRHVEAKCSSNVVTLKNIIQKFLKYSQFDRLKC